MKHLFSIFLFCLCSISLSAQEYRDVVYLKNGSVIKGFYKSFFLNDTLRMETLDGSLLVCPASEIVRIAKERTNVYVVHADEEEGIIRRWRPKGYSGSFEYLSAYRTTSASMTSTGFSTTHGYRFNRNIFLGAGMGFESYFHKVENAVLKLANTSVSLYGEGRFYLMNTRIAPVLTCRGGYTATGIKGQFVAPGIGVDFSTSPRFGIFVRFMYRWQRFDYDWIAETENKEFETVRIQGNASFYMFSGGIHF